MPSGHVRRIDSDALVISQVAQENQEVSFAAADLHDSFIAEIVTFDEAGRQVSRELVEARRKRLLLFIALGITSQLGTKT